MLFAEPPVGVRFYGRLMTTTDQRVKDLEMRVDRLETWAGPGQAEALSLGLSALRAETAIFRQEMNRALGGITADFARLNNEVGGVKTDVAILTNDVAVLKTDVAILTNDVAVLKTDVAVLKTDISEVKTDVALLKTDISEVKGAVYEILRRLPPAA
jgi:septal ring factor EnvC (AmiA/AmiB activator)